MIVVVNLLSQQEFKIHRAWATTASGHWDGFDGNKIRDKLINVMMESLDFDLTLLLTKELDYETVGIIRM